MIKQWQVWTSKKNYTRFHYPVSQFIQDSTLDLLLQTKDDMNLLHETFSFMTSATIKLATGTCANFQPEFLTICKLLCSRPSFILMLN